MTASHVCFIKGLLKFIVITISALPFFFFLVYFFSLFFFKKNKTFKIIIFLNTFFLIIFSLPITSYILKLPLYPKKNIYEENLDKNYSLILVPTAGFEKKGKFDFLNFYKKLDLQQHLCPNLQIL